MILELVPQFLEGLSFHNQSPTNMPFLSKVGEATVVACLLSQEEVHGSRVMARNEDVGANWFVGKATGDLGLSTTNTILNFFSQ